MKSLLAVLGFVYGCGGTTGSALVTFSGEASGPSDSTGGPLSFRTGAGADVTLTKARLHVGAVYLNQTVPASGAAAEPCISPGIYVAELFGGVDVDLLSPEPVAFPSRGEGTATTARTAEVWLVGGDVNASDDATHILEVEGNASQGGASYPFTAVVSIGANRKPQVSNTAMPGANPICHQRIVTPILVDVTPKPGGTLALQIDPRPMFAAVDFAKTSEVSNAPGTYEIPDTSSGAGGALFKGLTASFGVYAFSFRGAGQ